MIVTCPECRTRYRVDPGRVGPSGAQLRCRRCHASVSVPAIRREAQERPAPRGGVLLALADPELAKATRQRLQGLGLSVHLEDDGVDAILAIQRGLPQAAVVDARLPSMSGFQLCELMKRNESLRAIPLLLVVTDEVVPTPEFAAAPAPDSTLDAADLPEGIDAALREAGLSISENAPAALAPRPQEPPGAPATDPGLQEERERAERLARIVISDIILYNEARFSQAVRAGNVVEAMEAELREGRALFETRIDPRVRAERDFLAEELLRVARERGAAAAPTV